MVFVLSFESVKLFVLFFFFSSRRRHTRCGRDWSSDVCSSDLHQRGDAVPLGIRGGEDFLRLAGDLDEAADSVAILCRPARIKDITEHGRSTLGAELRQNVFNAGDTAKALGFEAGTDVPVVERG